MKKNIIIGLSISVILIMLIGILVFKPLKNDTSKNIDNDISSEISNEIDIDNDIIDVNVSDQEVEQPKDDDTKEKDIIVVEYGMPYFLNDYNSYRTIYEEGYFSSEIFEIQDDELSKDDVTNVYKIMNLLYEVVYNEAAESTLEGYVEGITYDRKFRYKLNGFMKALGSMEEYLIESSFKISENVYYVNIFFTEPIGDAVEGAVIKDTILPVTYNSLTGILSCNRTIFRKPVNILIEDDKFKAHGYMVEGTTENTFLYLAISHKSNTDIYGDSFPLFNAITYDANGKKMLIPISVPLVDVMPYFPEETYYYKGTTMYMLDSVSGIEFLYKGE